MSSRTSVGALPTQPTIIWPVSSATKSSRLSSGGSARPPTDRRDSLPPPRREQCSHRPPPFCSCSEVESHIPAKDEPRVQLPAGTPFSHSGRSLKVRRLPWEQDQAGALPVVPTTFPDRRMHGVCRLPVKQFELGATPSDGATFHGACDVEQFSKVISETHIGRRRWADCP